MLKQDLILFLKREKEDFRLMNNIRRNEMKEKEKCKEIDRNNIKEIIKFRSNIYNFLSRAFIEEVNGNYLEDLKEICPYFEKLATETDDEIFIKGVETLSKYLKEVNFDSDAIDELERLFTILFLNVSPNDITTHVHPFESVYLSPSKLVMQDQRDEVMEFYAQYGLGVNESFKEPEDHISAELGFLSALNELIISDFNKDDVTNVLEKLRAHLRFMEVHLLKWIHLMGSDLRKADKNGFYSSLGDITVGFVRIDYNFLKDLSQFIDGEYNEIR
jgi:TorA maturation chaperone TorD